jgi:hypothetical protein
MRFSEEIAKWSQFGKFMQRLENDFPKITFVLKSNAGEKELPENHVAVDDFEVCVVC